MRLPKTYRSQPFGTSQQSCSSGWWIPPGTCRVKRSIRK